MEAIGYVWILGKFYKTDPYTHFSNAHNYKLQFADFSFS